MSEGSRDSRILILSQRQFQRKAFHGPQYEFEDVIAQIDDVQLLAPRAAVESPAGEAARHLINGTKRHLGVKRRSPPWIRPAMVRTPVQSKHDLFFAVFNDAYQLSYLHQMPGWRESCTRAVCFLLEAWSPSVLLDADYYQMLRQFDAVYLFTPASALALQGLGAPAPAFLAAGTDTLAFAPWRRPPVRSVDVFSYGRTAPAVHAQLLDMAGRDEIAYLYDSTEDGVVTHFPQHRMLQASIMKRSSFFLAHRINDSPLRRHRTMGEESLTTRYFEGAAGGAIMLGSSPPVEEFSSNFDWEDAIIDLPWDCTDVKTVLHDLQRQPERLARARASAISNSLLRHDWLYRWEQVLGDAGMPLLQAGQDRKAKLSSVANGIAPDVGQQVQAR